MLRHRASNVLREMSRGGDPSLNGVRQAGNRVSNRGRRHKGLHRMVNNPGPRHRDNNPGSKAHSRDSICLDNLGLQNRGSIPGKDNQDRMVPRPGPMGGRPISLPRSMAWHLFVP